MVLLRLPLQTQIVLSWLRSSLALLLGQNFRAGCSPTPPIHGFDPHRQAQIFPLPLPCDAKLPDNCCSARTSVPVPTPSGAIKSSCAHSFPFLLIRSNLAGVHGQNFTPPLCFRTLRVRSYQQFTLFIFPPPSVSFGCSRSFYSEATWQVLHGQNFNAPPRAIFLAACKVCPPRTRPSPQDCIHRTVDRKLALTLSLIYGEHIF